MIIDIRINVETQTGVITTEQGPEWFSLNEDCIALFERVEKLFEEDALPLVTQQDLIKREFHRLIEEREDNRSYIRGDSLKITLVHNFT